MGPTARAWMRALGVAATVIVLDQVVKAIVRASVERGARVDVLGEVLAIVNVRNDGIAFGKLSGGGALVTIVVAVALVALVAYFATHLQRPLAWLPTGMVLGGALGNVIDRVRDGAVTDFVKVPSWPAFNVADSAITIGVVLLIYVLELRPRHAPAPDG